MISHEQLTVKSVRSTLIESLVDTPHPYTNFNKFQLQLDNVNNINPFLQIRKYIHMPRDKFFKYRILQGDIFCNERLFCFRLSETQNCPYCLHNPVIESIRHVLWECQRTQFVWTYINSIVQRAFNVNYINYDTVEVGSEYPIPIVESFIVIVLKLILTKDRSRTITIEEVRNRLKTQFIIEQIAMRRKVNVFKKRWSKLEPLLFGGT